MRMEGQIPQSLILTWPATYSMSSVWHIQCHILMTLKLMSKSSSTTTTECHFMWWGHVQVLIVMLSTNPNKKMIKQRKATSRCRNWTSLYVYIILSIGSLWGNSPCELNNWCYSFKWTCDVTLCGVLKSILPSITHIYKFYWVTTQLQLIIMIIIIFLLTQRQWISREAHGR